MESDQQKTRFPRINAGHWWTLRDRFKASVPRNVDETYLATILGGMSAASARANVKAPLRIMGLINKDGAPTELAQQWRLDEPYPSVCKQIVESVYPGSLLDAVPMETPSVEAAKSWFMNVARVGDAAAGSMAGTYVMLCEADITKRREPKTSTTRVVRKTKPEPKDNGRVTAVTQEQPSDSTGGATSKPKPPTMGEASAPSLHIDVQIHISADSSEGQIDAIFSSMAKHLYRDSRADES